MTAITFNLSQRYKAAFGTFPSSGETNAATAFNNEGNYSVELYRDAPDDFEDIVFTYDQKEVKFASIPFSSKTPLNGVLAPPPILTFSQSKNLIETPINGSDNVVVERWGTKPWEIRIRGLLIDVENRHYPEEMIKETRQLFQFNNIVDVAGTQFFDKDIQSVYFTDFEITPLQGFQDTVQFTLTARSSTPVDFTLTNP